MRPSRSCAKAVTRLPHVGAPRVCRLRRPRVLVEALLERGDQGDLAEAQGGDRPSLAPLRADEGWAIRDVCCCGCTRCWPALAATTSPTATWWFAIAKRRNRLASKDTSHGPTP